MVGWKVLKNLYPPDRSPVSSTEEPCKCREDRSAPAICADDTCSNRAARIECVGCSKARCQNQRIQNTPWSNLEVFKVCFCVFAAAGAAAGAAGAAAVRCVCGRRFPH